MVGGIIMIKYLGLIRMEELGAVGLTEVMVNEDFEESYDYLVDKYDWVFDTPYRRRLHLFTVGRMMIDKNVWQQEEIAIEIVRDYLYRQGMDIEIKTRRIYAEMFDFRRHVLEQEAKEKLYHKRLKKEQDERAKYHLTKENRRYYKGRTDKVVRQWDNELKSRFPDYHSALMMRRADEVAKRKEGWSFFGDLFMIVVSSLGIVGISLIIISGFIHLFLKLFFIGVI